MTATHSCPRNSTEVKLKGNKVVLVEEISSQHNIEFVLRLLLTMCVQVYNEKKQRNIKCMVWRRRGALENLMLQHKFVLQDKLYLRRLAQVRRVFLLCTGTMGRVPSIPNPTQLNIQLVKRDPKELSVPTKQLNKKAAAHMIQGRAGPISIWQLNLAASST